jgi:hypothetical protein
MRSCVFWNVKIATSAGMVPYLLKQHIGFILNHKVDMKKSALEHEFSAFLQTFTEQSPGGVTSHSGRLEFRISNFQ